ncbi:MAG: hypothetical protein ACOC0O_04230 [Spirochaetota bacterium]
MSNVVVRLVVAGLVLLALASCGFFAADVTDGTVVVDVSGLPDGIVSVDVSILGDGMDEVTGTYTAADFAAGAEPEPLLIPAGTDRAFTLVIGVSNASPVTEYTVTGTVDIVAGELATITPTSADLSITGTKLVVPDHWNDRIVQIDDITGAGWTVLDLATDDPTYARVFDLEIGPDGRIYFTQVDGEISVVQVVGTIGDTSPTTLVSSSENGVYPEFLGVDQSSGRIYFTESQSMANDYNDTLHVAEQDGAAVTDLYSTISSSLGTGSEEFDLRGVAVDDDGVAYVLYWVANFTAEPAYFAARVLSYDPSGAEPVVGSHELIRRDTDFSGGVSWDIVAKRDGLYVTAPQSVGDSAVHRLDASLAVQASYGYLDDGETTPSDLLYGPSLFVGHRNQEIQFIDEDLDGTNDRIVELSDITGAGRTSFGSTGSGDDQFSFLYQGEFVFAE